MSVEENIHEIHLSNNIDKVEELAEDELANIDIVGSDIPEDVIDDHMPLVLGGLSSSIQSLCIQILEQKPQFPPLPALPQKMGKVAEKSLKLCHFHNQILFQ